MVSRNGLAWDGLLWLHSSRPATYTQAEQRCNKPYVSHIVLKRSALATTDTELRLMAAAAIIGLLDGLLLAEGEPPGR